MKEIKHDQAPGRCSCWVQCDQCDHAEYIPSSDFSAINKELRDCGWIVKKINGQWKEFCSNECFVRYLYGEDG